MFSLQLRMWLLVTFLFGIIYAVVVAVGTSMGVSNFYFYLALSAGMMIIQYLAGPKLVEWTMGVRYVTRQERPDLYRMVEDLSQKARIPTPKIGISQAGIPNAFAFGRGVRDGRVCVTEGILQLLDEEELRAVLGHEISHLKNHDVLTIMILSVIPMVLYRIAWSFLFFGRRRDSRDNTVLIGLAALIFYFITNLMVLYASRIREYFADRGSVMLGNKPSALASALYKLVYGSARVDRESLRETEGLKAFFINDPSQASHEIRELSQLDLDRSGTIDSSELALLRSKAIHVTFADRLMELLSTHPNMLKRIQHLSETDMAG